MPVRIYEIAKKAGVESKIVLAKAKELGIAGAKVASSTLDKITAEFLLEQLGWEPAAQEAPAAEAMEATAAPAVAGEAESAPPPEAPPTLAPPEPAPPAPPAPEIPAPPVPEAVAAPAAEPLPVPPIPVTLPVETPPVEPAVAAPTIQVPSQTPSVVERPASAAVVAPPSAPTPPAPPPPPPIPAPPKVGDRVGFINLAGYRPRSADRPGARAQSQAPARPAARPVAGGRTEPARGRDGRPANPPQRPAAPGARPTAGGRPMTPAEPMTGEEVTLRPPVTVRDLADVIRRKPFQVIADLMELGIFANVNQTVETDIAQKVAAKHGIRLRVTKRTGPAEVQKVAPKKEDLDPDDRPEDLKPRAPVVTIMGHVDHGKTSLLDVIRKSNVVAGEAGGITQHIGAYTINVPHPDRPKELAAITFLDTPGHAAFSAMRARGAHITDIVVLVVAANDGVMPQTLEALNHARDAGVPIVVAVNKIDHPNAQPMRVRQQLQERGLVPDDWGGDTQFVDVSALAKQGVDKLLAAILLQAELMDLRANPNRPARGNVVESGIEPGGPTATLLVRKGTLRPGQVIVCGEYHGKVRALVSAEGTRLKEAGPSTAVKVLGLNGAPAAGLEFMQVASEHAAREITEARRLEGRTAERTPKNIRLEDFLSRIDGAESTTLRVVLKADTQGSVEAIVGALKEIRSDKVSLQIIHSDVGAITESDVQLAASGEGGVILGFHTRVDNSAAEMAKREGVQIKLYAIIYELIDAVKAAMAGLLPPVLKENVFGTAEVRKLFTLSKGGTVAGCVVTSGRITKGKVRVLRRRNVLFEGILQTLRRFQDDVNEVRAGMECGIRLENFNDFQEGDIVECYNLVEVPQSL